MTAVWKARGRKALIWALRILAGIVALPLLYFLAALILGVIPANVAFHQPAEGGVVIYIRSNGIHTDIVMPKVNADADWRPYANPEDLHDPRWGAADHVAIGYGARDFYLNTPTWADLTVRNAVFAAFGNGETLLHVEHDNRPRPDEWQRPLKVTPQQYRRLVDYIRHRFRLDADGRTIPLRGRGYSDWDMFYEANGGYSFILTCNEYQVDALRQAGVRTGLWTPLNQSIMWRLD